MSSVVIFGTPPVLLLIALMLPLPLTYAFPMKYTKDGSSNDEEILFAAGFSPYAITYGEWTAKWWQWAYSIPKDVHPAYDDSGKYCSQDQGGPVWFLAGSYKHPAERYCTIPAGKSILLPILNPECS